MAGYTGNALIAKAKSIFGERLHAEDYEELLKLETVPEIVRYLKSHDKYRNVLSDIDEESVHRGYLENLIRQSYFERLTKLVKFVSTSDKKFYELDMIRREIEIVMSGIRIIISGSIENSIGDLPLFFRKHASFDIDAIFKATNMNELLIVLEKTRYYDLVNQYYTDNIAEIRYTDIEHSLYGKYHEIVIARINKYYKGKLRQQLMNIYQSKVEIENIIKIYRLRKFYNADEYDIMKTIITDNIRMSNHKLHSLINLKNPDDILDNLSKSKYKTFTDSDDFVYVEYQAGKIKYNIAKRYMYFSTYPPIIYSVLLFLNEIEQTNIINIIEGVRYDVTQKDIQRMLIY